MKIKKIIVLVWGLAATLATTGADAGFLGRALIAAELPCPIGSPSL